MDQKRAVNFSKEEEFLLITLVDKYKTIIENKKSDAQTWRDKENAWLKLEKEFNSACTVASRSVKVLKEKYRNLKRKTKEKFAKNKSEINKTGGGKYIPPIITEIEEAVRNIIGDQQICGLQNTYDCDADNATVSIPDVTSQSIDASDEMMEIISEEVEIVDHHCNKKLYLPDKNCSTDLDMQEFSAAGNEPSSSWNNSSNRFIRGKSRSDGTHCHVSKKLKTVEVSASETQEQQPEKDLCSNWTNYSISNFRTPVTKNLRINKGSAEFKKHKNMFVKKYTNLNTTLIQEKLDFLRLQREAFSEEHSLKMQILKKKLEKN